MALRQKGQYPPKAPPKPRPLSRKPRPCEATVSGGHMVCHTDHDGRVYGERNSHERDLLGAELAVLHHRNSLALRESVSVAGLPHLLLAQLEREIHITRQLAGLND